MLRFDLRQCLKRKIFGFERTYMYDIFITGPLCTSECASECRLSSNLCKLAPDVNAEATRNADMLTINASEDIQENVQSNMKDYKTHSEEKQSDHTS